MRGGKLVIAVRGDVGALNPYVAADATTSNIVDLLYPRLFHEQLGSGVGRFAPALASGWSWQPDGRTLHLTLQPQARWSDGRPLTCDDLVYTLGVRHSDRTGWSGAREARAVEAVRCLDPHSAEIRFASRRADALALLNDNALVSANYRSIPLEQWRAIVWPERAIGAGPFRIGAFRAGQELVLHRDPTWWGSAPAAVDEVVFRIFPDDTLAFQAFLSGEVDLVERLPLTRLAEVTARPGRSVYEVPSLAVTQIVWNQLAPNAYRRDRAERGCAAERGCHESPADLERLRRTAPHPLLIDRRVRRALMLALDRQDLVDGLLQGKGRVGTSPVVSSLWAHDHQPPERFDPQAAAALLQEAGWMRSNPAGVRQRAGRPLRIELLVNAESAVRRDVAERCRSMLALVGVDLVIEAVPRSEYALRAREKAFDALLIGWRAGTRLSTDLTLQDAVDLGPNMGSWSTDRSEQLLQQAMSAPDEATARPLWVAWQALFRQEQPLTVLYEEPNLIGINARVVGATPSALNPYDNLSSWWIDPSP